MSAFFSFIESILFVALIFLILTLGYLVIIAKKDRRTVKSKKQEEEEGKITPYHHHSFTIPTQKGISRSLLTRALFNGLAGYIIRRAQEYHDEVPSTEILALDAIAYMIENCYEVDPSLGFESLADNALREVSMKQHDARKPI